MAQINEYFACYCFSSAATKQFLNDQSLSWTMAHILDKAYSLQLQNIHLWKHCIPITDHTLISKTRPHRVKVGAARDRTYRSASAAGIGLVSAYGICIRTIVNTMRLAPHRNPLTNIIQQSWLNNNSKAKKRSSLPETTSASFGPTVWQLPMMKIFAKIWGSE